MKVCRNQSSPSLLAIPITIFSKFLEAIIYQTSIQWLFNTGSPEATCIKCYICCKRFISQTSFIFFVDRIIYCILSAELYRFEFKACHMSVFCQKERFQEMKEIWLTSYWFDWFFLAMKEWEIACFECTSLFSAYWVLKM